MAVAQELKAARETSNPPFPVNVLQTDMDYEQAVLTCRATSGAMWALRGSTRQRVAEAAQKDKHRPLLPPGMTPGMAESANNIELPEVHRLHATFLALASAAAAAASAVADSIARAKCSHILEERSGRRSPTRPGTPSVPADSSESTSEACARLRLFAPHRTTVALAEKSTADPRGSADDFLEALHLHNSSRSISTKEGKKSRSLLRMPAAIDGPATVAVGSPKANPATLGATPSGVAALGRSSRFFAQLCRTMVLATGQPVADSEHLQTALVQQATADQRLADSEKQAKPAVASRLSELINSVPDWYAERVTEHALRRCALALGLPLELEGHGSGRLNKDLPLLVGAASGSLHIIPLVIMTLRAPLPPGWIAQRHSTSFPPSSERTEAAVEEREEFVHEVSRKSLPFHPLIHTFRRLANGELRRKRGSRFATFTCHEWILMAVPKQPMASRRKSATSSTANDISMGLEPMWINLLSGKRCPEFPVLSPPFDAVYTRKNGWAAQKRDVRSLYDLTTLRHLIGRVPSAMTLRERGRDARARALAHRPLTMYEVLYMAELMGIDPFEHPQLMFLAEEAMCLELPLGWSAVETAIEDGSPEGGCFFTNSILQISQWQHPKLTYLISLARIYGAPDADASEDIEKD